MRSRFSRLLILRYWTFFTAPLFLVYQFLLRFGSASITTAASAVRLTGTQSAVARLSPVSGFPSRAVSSSSISVSSVGSLSEGVSASSICSSAGSSLGSFEKSLCALTGLAHFTFKPYAGAHGELTGLMTIDNYHRSRGDMARKKVIVPDSAHGTNPASAAVCGLEIIEVKSGADGLVDIVDLERLVELEGPNIAAMMMTNPNTLGLFETRIPEIAELIHGCGGLMYYDGANLNPMLGACRPGDMGFDVMHINLHKTFSTPHGGGGPGSGPVGVREGLQDFFPFVSPYQGNYAVMMRAYAYICSLGRENVRMVGPLATLNANYIKESLKDVYELPIDTTCCHEFVFDGLKDKSTGVTTMDVAKRLLDYGYHAPTIYFPLLFHESLMIEPTENESKETLDGFIAVMRKIAEEAKNDPELVKSAPHDTPIGRVDDVLAAKHPVTTYRQLLAE